MLMRVVPVITQQALVEGIAFIAARIMQAIAMQATAIVIATATVMTAIKTAEVKRAFQRIAHAKRGDSLGYKGLHIMPAMRYRKIALIMSRGKLEPLHRP